jgi:hypothetical protein
MKPPANHLPGVLFLAVAFAGLILLIIAKRRWTRDACNAMIAKWAAAHGYEVLDARRIHFTLGRDFWLGYNQVLLAIRVRDSAGRERTGVARCGSYWNGPLTERVEVRWDTPSESPRPT